MAAFKSHREWGSVDGDTNAQAIFQDRRQSNATHWVGGAVVILWLGSAIAFGVTGADGWLASLIVSSVWAGTATVENRFHELKTWIMVTERRAQLIEQDLDDLESRMRGFPRDD